MVDRGESFIIIWDGFPAWQKDKDRLDNWHISLAKSEYEKEEKVSFISYIAKQVSSYLL